MINLKDIKKTFNENNDDVHVLRDVNFNVSRGEMIAITGVSGSGKSTLLNIISTIMKPDSGSYLYQDLDILKNSQNENTHFRNGHIGYVFQSFGLLEDDNAYNNIVLPLRYHKTIKKKEWRQRVDAISSELDIKHLLRRKVQKLSGGEKQRVAIARAVIAEQDLILADEPTGSLDKDNTDRIMDLFKQLHRNGKTLIIATHDLNLAVKCDKSFSLVDGQLVLDMQ